MKILILSMLLNTTIDKHRKSFEMDFNVDTKHIKITISDVEGHARCIHSTKTVLINKEFWNKISNINKKELIYHELGHCALNLRHSSGIMKMKTFQTDEDDSNWNELVEEMKGKM